MAYFSNGSEGDSFIEGYCVHCINWREREWRAEVGEGCPVWDLHELLDQYHACNADPIAEGTGLQVTKFVLDFLIEPQEGDGQRCSMFEPRGGRQDPDTLDLFGEPPEASAPNAEPRLEEENFHE